MAQSILTNLKTAAHHLQTDFVSLTKPITWNGFNVSKLEDPSTLNYTDRKLLKKVLSVAGKTFAIISTVSLLPALVSALVSGSLLCMGIAALRITLMHDFFMLMDELYEPGLVDKGINECKFLFRAIKSGASDESEYRQLRFESTIEKTILVKTLYNLAKQAHKDSNVS